ncbi:MAG: inositol monophosphatase, partial [Anaerolinea sp.]|nr:inositol monophosphatase [Anaerolinea sp.]
MLDRQAVRAAIEAIARRAGAEVMQYFGRPHTEAIKSNIFDVVTEGDRASEAIIVPALRAQFPDIPIISEEGGVNPDADPQSPYTWYIDPIDGTTNFAVNLPFFAISIALADTATHEPVAGVVYNPVYDELFSAARGFGSTLNGRPIHVTGTEQLNRAVLSTGFPYQRQRMADNNLRQWEQMLMEVRDLRRFGSAALDMAFVAAGRLDGYWEKHIHAWDVLAGILIVTEAGGRASDYAGGTAKLYSG